MPPMIFSSRKNDGASQSGSCVCKLPLITVKFNTHEYNGLNTVLRGGQTTVRFPWTGFGEASPSPSLNKYLVLWRFSLKHDHHQTCKKICGKISIDFSCEKMLDSFGSNLVLTRSIVRD